MERIAKRTRAVEELVSWVLSAVRVGQFREGDPFPPERYWRKQFRLGRTAVREAKAWLEGAGVLETHRMRTRFALRDQGRRLGDWVNLVRATPGHPKVSAGFREVLELWRVLAVEAFGLAASRGTLAERRVLAQKMHLYAHDFICSADPFVLDNEYRELLREATKVGRSGWLQPLVRSLDVALADQPFWDSIHFEGWRQHLHRVADGIADKQPARVRNVVRKELKALHHYSELMLGLTRPKKPRPQKAEAPAAG